jgi:hypothetical protein
VRCESGLVKVQCGWLDVQLKPHGGCGSRWFVADLPPGAEGPIDLDPGAWHEACAREHQKKCSYCGGLK